MSLKLDFSRPLVLGGLNLGAGDCGSEESGLMKAVENFGLTGRSEERRGKR